MSMCEYESVMEGQKRSLDPQELETGITGVFESHDIVSKSLQVLQVLFSAKLSLQPPFWKFK